MGAFSAPPAADERPAIGTSVRELRFKDIRGLPRSLSELGNKRAYVLAFVTTECPLVRRTIPKLVELDRQLAAQDVQFVAINVGAENTIRDMASQALELDAPFPFVKDADYSCVDALGVTRTPEVVVLDGQRKLVYRGRVDDQLRLGGARPEPTRRDLEEALQKLLAGDPVSVPETPVDGCLITRPPPPDDRLPLPTFHRDVAPILQRRCVSCHRPGTAAPFSLLTYSDAVSQAEMLAEVVVDQRMPPWFAHERYGRFQNDPSLTREERDILVNWVRTGRAAGDERDAPPPFQLPDSDWRIGKPDLVLTLVEQHSVPATGYVPYRYAILPHVFTQDTWVEAAEIRPDNVSVVHHCNMAYASVGGAGERTFITGHVPGGQPLDLARFDNGTAVLIPRFSVLGLQIHYTTTGKPETCRISVGLRFPRKTVHKQIHHFLLDPHNIRIPPGHGAYPVRSSRTLQQDVTLLGLFTHMHLRGKDMTFYAHPPNGPRETLLQIANYNFEWQLGYELTSGTKRLPAGTKIEAVAHFDNSAFNPFNPDPTRTVPWGLQSYDEMFNGFVFFVHDQEDLNLTIDPQTGHSVATDR